MKNLIKISFAFVLALGSGVCPCATDQKIADCVNNVFTSIHGDVGYIAGAFELCEHDTNRFVRIMFNMITNTPEHASYYMGLIGDYGTASDAPFLENYVTNTECGHSACNAILTISGINSNSLRNASLYNSLTNSSAISWQGLLFYRIVELSNQDGIPADDKALGMEYAWNYASNSVHDVWLMDGVFKTLWPPYTNGTMRVDFLNYKLSQGINDYDRNFISNRLNEIQSENSTP